MSLSKEAQRALSQSAMILPQEQMQPVGQKHKKLFIGIPKEISMQENRVAMVPEAVQLLVNNGHRVKLETGAGEASHFSDNEYS